MLSGLLQPLCKIFHVKIQLFVTLKSGQDPDSDPHWFGSLDPNQHCDTKLDQVNADPDPALLSVFF
jgi:hypothetical protein